MIPTINMKITKSIFVFLLTYLISYLGNAQSAQLKVDYASFLSKHDLVWNKVPDKWQLAPYTGNGNVGFLLYQAKEEDKNTLSLHIGRHDYADHREAPKAQQLIWIYRSRLPLGHFNITSKGDITGIDMRLSLWDAELTGTVSTTTGSYQIKGFTHSNQDVIYFETQAKDGESVQITWHPDDPFPPVWEALQAGQGPKAGGQWEAMRKDPMIMPDKYSLSQEGGFNFCYQPLYKNRGETTTGWKVSGRKDQTQALLVSIHHSFPEHDSKSIVTNNLQKAVSDIATKSFIKTHQKWWHDYYPLSFLTINDAEKEAFYWIQIYKFASATRQNGPIMDLMGPWYNRTFWPMVWGDLNVQLQYWTHLTANRLSVGESLPNSIDKYAKNLEGNVSETWENSAALGALFPQDFNSYNGDKVPDMLAWLLHDYWLHCQYAGDWDRLRDHFFPLLRKTANSYLNYLKDNPMVDTDGTIHIKNSWSPEYKPGHGQDINFTIALMRWSFQTLLDLNNRFEFNDPKEKEWQKIMDQLVDFQIDQHGLRIGKDIPFDKPHRHYSHLLAFYPLAVLNADIPEEHRLVQTSVDHWLDVSINSGISVKAMPVTGYTATGAASMYATLGDQEKALYYLDFFINHQNVSPTTMYSEVKINPVIESPLSFATCIHDMLLQSWGNKIRVFPGTPDQWKNAAFHQLRTQGAFLVSAKKKKGNTQFVAIESLAGSPCVVYVDIANPKIYINSKEVTKTNKVKRGADGTYTIALKTGETVLFSTKKLNKTDLTIREIKVADPDKNLFGFSNKTERLPGHQYYNGLK